MKILEKNEFELIFQGNKHEVSARTLAETISNFDILVNEINKILIPEYPIELKVKTFEEGSFEVLFALFAEPTINQTVFSILKKDNIELAGTIISTISDLFSIKQFLAGEKPAEIEKTRDNQTIVKNNKGDIKVINSKSGDIIFNNPIVNVTINNTFNSIGNEQNLTGVKFVSNLNEKQIEIPKNILKDLAEQRLDIADEIEQISEDKRIVRKHNEPLSIIKIVFEQNNKWQFLTKLGHKISALIKDNSFFERIKKNDIYFGFGDVMFVDLEVTQEYNQIAKAYENKSYVIIAIRDIKHNGQQSKLDI
ncbi:hypothetical protein NU10_13725 [Flavobacterium dauae]|uniref:hypothetical protein n=1 Tax=Flavobacterium dauae TaxID=1563479 RepID=UPI00101B28CA|nr:hypothetical protein [Flavobacterium dauae]WLD23746.1 hypothetical protein NU10_13725 [Flavobacterium dauae]